MSSFGGEDASICAPANRIFYTILLQAFSFISLTMYVYIKSSLTIHEYEIKEDPLIHTKI